VIYLLEKVMFVLFMTLG